MHTLTEHSHTRNWLSEAALWTVTLAWAAAGVWGWMHTSSGLIAPVFAALTLAAQIAGARMVAIAASAPRGRSAVLIALALGCVCWSGFAGKRAIETSEAQRLAPVAAYAAAEARVAEAAAAIAAAPALPLTDETGRAIGPQRLALLQEARAVELARRVETLARAEAARDALPKPAGSAERMPAALMWAVAALVECLELLGFWAIGSGGSRTRRRLDEVAQPQPAPEPVRNPAAELARKRWARA